MKETTQTIKIGELSKQSGVSIRMIRHYEKFGLLKPKRNSKFRIYTWSTRQDVSRIKFFQGLGFSLQEISRLMPLLKSKSLTTASKAIDDQLEKCNSELQDLKKRGRWLSRVKKKLESRGYGKHECSFCGAPKSDVGKLIAGPIDFICDSCVAWCKKATSIKGTQTTAEPWCSFCGENSYLIAGPAVSICKNCINICKTILRTEAS